MEETRLTAVGGARGEGDLLVTGCTLGRRGGRGLVAIDAKPHQVAAGEWAGVGTLVAGRAGHVVAEVNFVIEVEFFVEQSSEVVHSEVFAGVA